MTRVSTKDQGKKPLSMKGMFLFAGLPLEQRIGEMADLLSGPEDLGSWGDMIPRIRESLEEPGSGSLAWDGSGAKRAFHLVDAYLTQLEKETRKTVSGFSRLFLAELIRNMLDWLSQERGDQPVFRLIPLAKSDLSDGAYALRERIRDAVDSGLMAVILDLRGLQTLTSPEIGGIISVLRVVPDWGHSGMLLDPVQQGGLIRALKVMALDRAFRIWEDEAQLPYDLNL